MEQYLDALRPGSPWHNTLHLSSYVLPVPAIPDCTLSPSSPCCFWKAPVQGGTSPFPVWSAASPLQTSGTSPVRSGTAWRLNVTAAVPEQLLSNLLITLGNDPSAGFQFLRLFCCKRPEHQ